MDVPQCHNTNSVHKDHDNGEQVEQTREQIQTQQQAAHHKGWQQTQGDVEEPLWHNRQVLLIKYISYPVPNRKTGNIMLKEETTNCLFKLTFKLKN